MSHIKRVELAKRIEKKTNFFFIKYMYKVLMGSFCTHCETLKPP